MTSRSLFFDISMTYPSLVVHPGLHGLNDLALPENAPTPNADHKVSNKRIIFVSQTDIANVAGGARVAIHLFSQLRRQTSPF
jgi:hypothetical protein